MWERMYTFTKSGNAQTHVHRCCCCCCGFYLSSKGWSCWSIHCATEKEKERGAAEVHTVDMYEADQLATLGGAVLALEPIMRAYQRRHRSYKFQIAVDVMFHKAVDPAVVTQPPVTLSCEMAAVYADGSPQLVETARHLLELIEVYEHNGSGLVFSSFVSLQLTLWQLDPLRAGAFVPLPK